MDDDPKHLQRLGEVWQKQPVYFITTCVAGRRPLLADEKVHAVLREEWRGMSVRHGWTVGRYVIMPDHVHFFLSPQAGAARALPGAVGKWKEWTAKRVLALGPTPAPLWQAEFFDHLLRSAESRAGKWEYVRENPVRAGLVARAEDWPFAGWIDFE
jgi:putative transposase